MTPPTSTDPQAPIRVWVSLGSNIEPATNLRRAVEVLAERLGLAAVSSLYASAAQGAPGSPGFLNAAVELETALDARQLKFDVLRPLEAEMGRVRTADPNAPRVIDLDLALFGDRVIDSPEIGLVVPDPELLTSAHVILPVAEIAPDIRHPVTGERLEDLGERFRGAAGIRIVGSIELPGCPIC